MHLWRRELSRAEAACTVVKLALRLSHQLAKLRVVALFQSIESGGADTL